MIKPEECASGRCLFLWMVVMDEIFWDTFSYYRFPLGNEVTKKKGKKTKQSIPQSER